MFHEKLIIMFSLVDSGRIVATITFEVPEEASSYSQPLQPSTTT
jgi:hypothetical protein